MCPSPATATVRVEAAPAERITAPVLVDARWLLNHHEDVRVIDVRPGSVRRREGCIPTSRTLPEELLQLTSTTRPDLQGLVGRVQQACALAGLAPTDHVVLIDEGDGTASFAAALCELAGMRRVSVALGDLVQQWSALGGELVADVEAPIAPGTGWHGVTARQESVAAFEDLVDAVVDGTARVLDVRAQLEHEGIVGAHCCAAQGAIPGSVHLEWTALLDQSGMPHGKQVVTRLLAQVGIEPDAPVIVTCHAGHRAAIAVRILRSAGVRGARLSPGSWHEWSHRGLADD